MNLNLCWRFGPMLLQVHAKGSNKHGSKKGKGEHQVAHSFAGQQGHGCGAATQRRRRVGLSCDRPSASVGPHRVTSPRCCVCCCVRSSLGRLLGDSSQSIPKYELCEDGMDAKAALQAVLDECMLDGKPDLNLASFVGTWMEEEANELLLKTCKSV